MYVLELGYVHQVGYNVSLIRMDTLGRVWNIGLIWAKLILCPQVTVYR